MNTLVVEVHRHPDGKVTFRQPPDRNSEDYLVRGHQIRIFRNVCPVNLQFDANVPLSAIGFEEIGGPLPPPRHEAGPCGGCFSLVSGFKAGGGVHVSPLICNHGNPDRPQGARYRFMLWTFGDDGEDVVLTMGIDPQIYNQGDGTDEGD